MRKAACRLCSERSQEELKQKEGASRSAGSSVSQAGM